MLVGRMQARHLKDLATGRQRISENGTRLVDAERPRTCLTGSTAVSGARLKVVRIVRRNGVRHRGLASVNVRSVSPPAGAGPYPFHARRARPLGHPLERIEGAL